MSQFTITQLTDNKLEANLPEFELEGIAYYALPADF